MWFKSNINRVLLSVTLLAIAAGCSDKDSAAANTKTEVSAELSESNTQTENELPPITVVKRDTPIEGHDTIEWTDLIPAETLEILLNPPEYIYDIVDGSEEDMIDSNLQATRQQNFENSGMSEELAAELAKQMSTEVSESQLAYERALNSTDIVPEMDKKPVRVPGFVVPVVFNDKQVITGFFLVPYFGACIHSPPPPPNQIIYVETEQGFVLDALYDPVWVSGTLTAEMFEDPLATSAYTMSMADIELYYEPM